MKKFRFSTIHFVMIGVILFGLVSVLHRMFPMGIVTVFALFLSLPPVLRLFHYYSRGLEVLPSVYWLF